MYYEYWGLKYFVLFSQKYNSFSLNYMRSWRGKPNIHVNPREIAVKLLEPQDPEVLLLNLWLPSSVTSNFFKVYFLNIFFFLRKISLELTAANPPVFAEEDWPWANIHAHLPLLYTWDTCHSMACQAVPRPHPGSEPANPGCWSRTCELNCCATGPAPVLVVFWACF